MGDKKIALLPDVGILFCCGCSFILVGDCLKSLVLVLPRLHSGDVHKQALISSSSFAIFVREHWFWGLIGLSTGPSSILDGTKQSMTSPEIWKLKSAEEWQTKHNRLRYRFLGYTIYLFHPLQTSSTSIEDKLHLGSIFWSGLDCEYQTPGTHQILVFHMCNMLAPY